MFVTCNRYCYNKQCHLYLLILWQLVGGYRIEQMQKYMAKSTFFIIYNRVWNSEKTQIISKKLKDLLNKMFSNERIRVLSAKLYNPVHFRSGTLILRWS